LRGIIEQGPQQIWTSRREGADSGWVDMASKLLQITA